MIALIIGLVLPPQPSSGHSGKNEGYKKLKIGSGSKKKSGSAIKSGFRLDDKDEAEPAAVSANTKPPNHPPPAWPALFYPAIRPAPEVKGKAVGTAARGAARAKPLDLSAFALAPQEDLSHPLAAPDLEPAPKPDLKAIELVKAAREQLNVGDFTRAIGTSGRIIESVKNTAESKAVLADAHAVRAEAYNRAGKHAQAAVDLKRALYFGLRNSAVHENLAWALLKVKKYGESEKIASAGLEISSDDQHRARLLALRAFSHEVRGNNPKALADIEAAALHDPRYLDMARAARSGQRLYDPDGQNSSYLVDVILFAKGPNRGRSGATAVFSLLAAGLGGFFLRRRIPKPRGNIQLMPQSNGLLAGKYQLGRVIGKGGMGEVREALDVSLGRRVAVKKLSSKQSECASGMREDLIKEARIVASIHHPAIVDIYEIVTQDSDVFLVFELVSGKTLHQILAENGRLGLDRCRAILRPLCEALEFAHSRNLLHRDIKPANIMVTEQGYLKLMDFGIARSIVDRPVMVASCARASAPLQFNHATTAAGTKSYMSPEAEEGLISKQGDIYSLGATLYEMLTGLSPFPEEDSAFDKIRMKMTKPSALASGIPPEIDALIESALNTDPARRPAGAREFARRLGIMI